MSEPPPHDIVRPLPLIGRALQTGAKVGTFWLLATGLGLLFQAAIAARLGVSHLMDGYLVAITLPLVASAVSNTALNYVIVPKLRPMVGSIRFWSHLAALLLTYGAVAAVAVPIAWWLAPSLVHLLAPGLGGDTSLVATRLLRLLTFGLFLDLLRGISAASYYARDHYMLPASTAALFAAAQIVTTVVLLDRLGVVALGLAWISGYAVSLAALLLPLIGQLITGMKRGIEHDALLPSKFAWAVGITSLLQSAPVIDRFFASRLGPGAIAYLGYSSKLTEIAVRTVPLAFGLALFPSMSDYIRKDDSVGLKRLASASLRPIVFLGIPVAFAVVLLRAPIIELIYQRGSFSTLAAERVSALLIWYGPALVPLSLTTVMTYLFFAKGAYRALTGLGALLLALTAGLDGFGSALFGYEGIAIASLITACALSLAALFVFFGTVPWRVSHESLRPVRQLFVAMTAEAAILSVVASISTHLHGIGLAVVFAIGLAGGMLGYAAALHLTGNHDMQRALTQLRKGEYGTRSAAEIES